MEKVYFRNGEFVQPVVNREEVKYEIHKNYILRTENDETNKITLDDMANEIGSNKNLTDEENHERTLRFIKEFGSLLKDAPKEILDILKDII